MKVHVMVVKKRYWKEDGIWYVGEILRPLRPRR